jgi:hypothetical protein
MSSYSTMSSLSCFLSSDVNSGDIWTSSTLSFLCKAGEIAKDQSLCICLDFRDLNKQTIFDPVLMPRMDEVLNKVSKARYISKLVPCIAKNTYIINK